MLYLNQKDFLLDYLFMFPGHCHSNVIKSHRPRPEEAKPPRIKLLSNNIIRVFSPQPLTLIVLYLVMNI